MRTTTHCSNVQKENNKLKLMLRDVRDTQILFVNNENKNQSKKIEQHPEIR